MEFMPIGKSNGVVVDDFVIVGVLVNGGAAVIFCVTGGLRALHLNLSSFGQKAIMYTTTVASVAL